MADTYVLVHGAWHTGEQLEPVASHLRARGHVVHCPTLAGNQPGDDRSVLGLSEAAQSLVDFQQRFLVAAGNVFLNAVQNQRIDDVLDQYEQHMEFMQLNAEATR